MHPWSHPSARRWVLTFATTISDFTVIKILTCAAISLLLAGCATPPRDADIRAAAVQILGTNTNLKIHEVLYAGPMSSVLGALGTSEELALASAMQPGATRDLDLVVWSRSSSKAASVLLRALSYPGAQQLPHLRLLFVGDSQDAGRVRQPVVAAGARFYFRQK